MKNLIFIGTAAALLAMGHTAQATVFTITQGTNTYDGIVNGTLNPAYQLTIAYDVTETTGVGPNPFYTYDYTLTTAPAEDLTSFTVGGMNDPIDTLTMGNLVYGQANPAASGFNSNSVGWLWGFNSNVTADTVGFTSDLPPDLASYTLNDDDIEWSSPALIPAPGPVPEPSSLALLASAALIFGFLKFRKGATLPPQKSSARR